MIKWIAHASRFDIGVAGVFMLVAFFFVNAAEAVVEQLIWGERFVHGGDFFIAGWFLMTLARTANYIAKHDKGTSDG